MSSKSHHKYEIYYSQFWNNLNHRILAEQQQKNQQLMKQQINSSIQQNKWETVENGNAIINESNTLKQEIQNLTYSKHKPNTSFQTQKIQDKLQKLQQSNQPSLESQESQTAVQYSQKLNENIYQQQERQKRNNNPSKKQTLKCQVNPFSTIKQVSNEIMKEAHQCPGNCEQISILKQQINTLQQNIYIHQKKTDLRVKQLESSVKILRQAYLKLKSKNNS